MFNELPSNFDFPAMEKEVLRFWEDNRVYEKSLDARKGGKPFVFFEGPPTANGLPHPGHCLTRAIKDLFPRYKTMTGHYCLRKGGWDTHGLPVEVEVCKELGIHSKEEIEAYGVEPFNRKCLESVFRYTKEWETLTRRLGFWVNLEEAYVTYHKSYVESVWWSLKKLFDAGMLYQGHKIVWWWAQGGTALSSGEVGQGYREVDDPSVFVRFPVVMDDRAKSLFAANATFSPGPKDQGDNKINASFLVWTTTPWTLPSNTFAAVHKDFDYAIVHDEETGERLIFAAALVEQIAKKAKKKTWKIERTVKGADLVGLSYRPPFDYYRKRPAKDFIPHAEPGIPLGDYKPPLSEAAVSSSPMPQAPSQYACWRVLHADFVTLDSGTGLVHEAPAFGEVDFDLLQKERMRFKNPESVPLLCAVAPNGKFTDDAPPYKGRWVKECDKDIVRELKEKKAYSATVDIPVLLHQEQYRHDYPFCWRADEDPLIQYPRRSWFIRTTQFKNDMLENNEHINWLPDHIKGGRFGKFLESNVDWSLSRERYWGTPLPIWVCDACGQMEAVESYESLMNKPGVAGLEVWENAKKKEPQLSDHLKVHKPYIDAIHYVCTKCGTKASSPESKTRQGGPQAARMRRVPDVIDCWYDSGAMPFAQWGFPHTGKDMFASQFPADFISEALDQTRGWFYSLTAISVMLFGKNGVAKKELADARKQGEHGPLARANHRGVTTTQVRLDLATRRRILPHWEMGGSTYFITFRLHEGQLSESDRDIVMSACRHWDGTRMELHAAVIMPDHVHLLFTPKEKARNEWWSLADLMHSIKGFTAQELNKSNSRSGSVWQQEYFDRIIRSEPDFEEKLNYIVTNPARRDLPEDYRWVWTQTHGPEAHAPLPYPHPFHNCIVLGLLMGEDGLKMSKSKKNYKEPSYIFDHEGTDAMRWLFFSGQTPWTSIRFQEAAIAEGQREFIIRLYNCYSFFVIYANIDKWTPTPSPLKGEGRGEGDERRQSPDSAANPLDRWIRSELAATSLRVYDSMEAYDNYTAARALIAFVDALSNWYVRRSRDRFWKTDMDADKRAAYETLHHCLVTTTKLIAPFTPFIAESMYQNLVRTHEQSAPCSVHLCDYPVTAETRSAVEKLVDAALNEEIEMVRQLVSCGRAARSASKLRVRQPLGAIELFHRRTDVVKRYDDIIRDELNVKRIEHVTNAQIDKYVNYQVKPNFQIIGPKHGPLAPKIKGLLAKHPNPDEIVRQMESQGTYHMNVDGQDVELTPDELMIELHAREGYAAERIPGCGILVLDTHITPELRDEGYARDLVNQIQQVRKNLDLRYEQRIHLAITGDADVTRVVNAHAAYICNETLAQSILNQPIAGVEPVSVDLDGHVAMIHVKAI